MNNKLLKNSVYNMIYRGFTALFPLITTGYISRVLLADGVGKVSYANTIVAYFTTIAALGIPNYGIKAIAQGKNKEDRSKTFIELFTINFISTAICTIVYYVFINTNSYFLDRRQLFNVMGFLLILNVFNIDWFYQGIEEYGYIATRGIAIKIVSFVLMLIFVKKSSDYVIYAFILCMATAGNYFFNAVHLVRYIDIQKYKLSIARHLKPVFVLLAAAIATEVYTMLDTLMLQYFHGDAYVGYYSNAVKIVRMVYTVVIAMVAAFYPRISHSLKNAEKNDCQKLLDEGTKIILLFSFPCVIGLSILSNLITVVLFGADFTPAGTTLRILSGLVFVFSIAYFRGQIVLMAAGKEKIILKATICGALINAVSNSLLIPRFYQNGAAIASILAELVVTSILVYSSSRVIPVSINRKYVTTLIVACFVMAVVIKIFIGMQLNLIIKLFASVMAGGTVYFMVLLLLKNEIVLEFKKKMIKHLH